jgi:hypothetical protein
VLDQFSVRSGGGREFPRCWIIPHREWKVRRKKGEHENRSADETIKDKK